MSTTRTKTNIITEMKNPDKELTRAQKEICKHFNLKPISVYKRIKDENETFEEALLYYINHKKEPITVFKGTDLEYTANTQKEICKHFKIYQSDVYARICKKHETFEQALSHCINKTIIVFKNTNLEFIGTKARICKYFRVSQKNISLRMKNKNETFEEAIKYYLNENVENTNNNNE